MNWYEQEENFVSEISASMESGITQIFGREVDGVWEYAVINRWYGSVNLISTFIENKETFNRGY